MAAAAGGSAPRNTHVAHALQRAGLATLLIDLLREDEEQDRRKVFDIPLLAARLAGAAQWVRQAAHLAALPVCYFGASTGAAAALLAASTDAGRIAAIVSRGGRPDLAGATALGRVRSPTLLIVGGRDDDVLALNRAALQAMHCERHLVIVPGATHLFEEPGTLDQVVDHATRWFLAHVRDPP
ncbi:dienelactone hydrolase family protein [Gluconacetobacter tumulisoli]|uniref:alpha/beta hydrolase n=1 Tax=Gluconacetobacter tumulisoli TaxID=1286189 RepID=UPI001FE5455B|nr:alpha/beta hydrolase [Gluconacetobacter tumulisoli]